MLGVDALRPFELPQELLLEPIDPLANRGTVQTP